MRHRHLFGLFLLSTLLASGQALITTLGGSTTGTCGYTGDGGPVAQATFCNPLKPAVGEFGNIYVPDAFNYAIRKITPAGIVTTIAGTGAPGTTGDGGPAASAALGYILQVDYDGGGHLCFADYGAHKIRCISLLTGQIQGYGTGNSVSAGDGGQFASASFGAPLGVAFVPRFQGISASADLYISDGNVVRKADGFTGIITTIAGTGQASGPSGDGGPATLATLNTPAGLAYSNANGSLYIAEYGGNRIRRVDLATGVITTVAGTGDLGNTSENVPATATTLNHPMLVAPDVIGNLYITGNEARVFKADTSGIIATAVGNGAVANGPDGVVPTQTSLAKANAAFWNPYANQLLIMDGHRIRQVNYQAATIAIAASPNPAPAHTQVTLTATVSPASATGSVNFYVNGALIGSSLLSGGQANYQWTADSTGTAAVAYQGDATYAPSFSSSLGIGIQNPLTFSTSPNPSGTNRPVTLTASVNIPTATGTVNFYNSGTLIGSANLVNGIAATTASFPSTGTFTLYAIYSGDANNPQYTSLSVSQKVLTESGATVYNQQSPATVGSAVTFYGGVNPFTATGSMQFFDGGTLMSTQTLVNGQANFTTSTLTQGSHVITTVYSGDTVYAPSISGPFTQLIKLASGFTVVSNLNPSTTGQTVTFTTSVNPAATGTVQISELSGTTLGTVTVNAGTAVVSTSTLATGQHSIRVNYSGDANYIGGYIFLTQVVNVAATSVTLASSQNPSLAGNAVTFTALVSPAAATGTVQFLDGAAVLGTVSLAGGAANFTAAALGAGTHSITAIYASDASNGGSTSAALSQVVKQNAGLSIASSLNPAVAGQAVTLTATLNAAATGTIQFLDSGALLGTITVSGGTAAFTTSSLAQGVHSIAANYGGDASYGVATTTLAQTINAKATTTPTLTSYANPSPANQPTTFAAAVSPSTATGTVQFLDGATVLGTGTLSGGSTTFTTSTLTQGTHSITAIYGGDALNAGSTSAALSQAVKLLAAGGLTIAPNPAVVGQTVTLTMTVPSAATGTVQFFEGSTLLSTANVVSGTATYSSSTFAVGTHTLNANYSGDSNYLSSGSALTPLTINNKTTTATSLSSNQNPSGVSVTAYFSISVSPTTATGTVQVFDGATVLGSVTLANGAATFGTSSLSQGTHSITAVYAGDAANAGSTSAAVSQSVKLITGGGLTINPNPAVVGQTVTLTETVNAAATGTVQFFEGSTLLGTATVVSGTATYSSAGFSVGTHTLNAVYSGDANYLSSGSALTPLTVNPKASTSTSIVSSLNPSTAGASVTFTATVSPAAATGTVQFLDGSTVLGTATLTGGAASLATSTLTQGSHSITSVYSGDSLRLGSTSAVLTQTVNVAAPSAPSNLAAAAASASQINLTWTASTTSGVTYNVYASTVSGFTPSASNRIASGVSATSYASTGLTASTAYYYRVTAVNGGGESAATSQASATTSGAGGLSCHVTYSVTTQWNVGFGTAISIQNTGTAAINNWNLTWTWSGNQAITQSWNANYTQTGANAKLTYMSYNSSIGAGATASGIGFNGSYSGTNNAPTAFYLNGTLCH